MEAKVLSKLANNNNTFQLSELYINYIINYVLWRS